MQVYFLAYAGHEPDFIACAPALLLFSAGLVGRRAFARGANASQRSLAGALPGAALGPGAWMAAYSAYGRWFDALAGASGGVIAALGFGLLGLVREPNSANNRLT